MKGATCCRGSVVLVGQIGYSAVMIARHILTVSAMLAMLPSQASARDWGYISGWYVTSANQSCGMYTQPVRPQTVELLILKRLDGAIYVQSKNPAWSIAPGSESHIQYQIDGRTYGGAQKTVALETAPGKGLMSALGSDFETEVRSGTMLAIVLNGRLIEQISLTGTSAAFATVQSCLNDLRSNGSNQAAGFASLNATSVTPKGDVGRWVTVEDYPGNAKREGREGTVGFRLAVGSDGKVFGCTITTTSGHSDLDAATCTSLTKRARFDPAKDAGGNVVAGSYQSRVNWKLPE
jgi:TonB family protein